MKIRAYLALMVLAIFIPIFIVAALALAKIQREERDASLRGLKETARAVSLIVDREVQGSLSALQVLGNSEHLETGNLKAFYAQAAALDRPDVWTVLLDASGTQLLNTRVPFGTAAPPPVALARVTQVIATQKPLISDLVVGLVTGTLLTSIYVPARSAGGKKFVVAQAFGVGLWKRVSLQKALPPSWIVGLIDLGGRFIARSHKTEELLGKLARHELVSAAAAAHDGLIRHPTV